MSAELIGSAVSPKTKKDLSRDAIALALKGEWEHAASLNRTILESFDNDVEAMNRLGKALMELGDYAEARDVLDQVTRIAPYNSIARKNLARLEQLQSAPAPSRQMRQAAARGGGRVPKAAGVPQRFIEESGKSGTTTLVKPAGPHVTARVAPNDPLELAVENDAIKVYTREDEYLGQVDPRLGRRLLRLIYGGNRYESAVVGVRGQDISIIIWETFRHRNLHNVCSFPIRTSNERPIYLSETLARYTRDDDLDDEDDEDETLETQGPYTAEGWRRRGGSTIPEEDDLDEDWDE